MSNEQKNTVVRAANDLEIVFGEGDEAGTLKFNKGDELNFHVNDEENIVIETKDDKGEDLDVEICEADLALDFLDQTIDEEELDAPELTETSVADLVLAGVSVDDIAKKLVHEKTVTAIRGGKKVKLVVKVGRRKKKLTAKQKAALAKARRKSNTGTAKAKRAKSMKVRKAAGLESAVSFEDALIESVDMSAEIELTEAKDRYKAYVAEKKLNENEMDTLLSFFTQEEISGQTKDAIWIEYGGESGGWDNASA